MALRCASAAGQTWLSLVTGYLLTLLAFGRRAGPAAPVPADPRLPVVVLVPAYNEEFGVADAVAPLRRQDYPDELLETVVIADNCTDATAERARAAGASVWERVAPDEPGKGQALRWAMARLWSERPEVRVVIIIDADCQASPNLVAAAAAAVADGAHAVQVDYVVANAAASAATSLRAAGFRLKHVIRARGRQRLGLSCSLFGTGMAFSDRLLREIPWPGSVTEDTELFVSIVAAGYQVRYVEEAAVLSRMPETGQEAEQQQLRWETGNAQLARAQLLRMAVEGLTRRDRQRIGAAAELGVPSQTLLASGNALLCADAALRRRRWRLGLAVATLLGQAVYVFGGLAAAGGSETLPRALAHLPRFLIRRLVVIVRVATGRGARGWVRTPR